MLEKSGVFNYVIAATIKRFGARKYALIAVLSLICMLMGSTMGLLEETVPLVPIIVALALALGFDTLTGLGNEYLSRWLRVCGGHVQSVYRRHRAKSGGRGNLFGAVAESMHLRRRIRLADALPADVREENREKSEKIAYVSVDIARRARYSYENDMKFLENRRVRNAAVIFGAALALVFVYIAVALLWSDLGLSDYTMPVMAVLITAGGLIAGKVSGYKRKGLAKDLFRRSVKHSAGYRTYSFGAGRQAYHGDGRHYGYDSL